MDKHRKDPIGKVYKTEKPFRTTLEGMEDLGMIHRNNPPEVALPAAAILEAGIEVQGNRAAQRDSPDGERSMAKTVASFNASEGTSLTETQGWRFMVHLKLARSVGGELTVDDYIDGASYFALAGESAQQENY